MAAKENFFKAHWDVLAAVAGAIALAASLVFLVMALGESPEDGAAKYEARLNAIKPSHEGVAETDISLLQNAFRMAKTPPAMVAVNPEEANFLASERRVLCAAEGEDATSKTKKSCGRPIPANAEVCPFCGTKQPTLVKIETDSDHDGLQDEWENQHGLNPGNPADANADADNDGFTNMEEFMAGTDPRDSKSHPDYLDSLSVAGPLKQTFLPFFFKEANPIPGGHRITFARLGVRSAVGVITAFRVKVGDPIKEDKIDTGYVLKAYNKKSEKRTIAGSATKSSKGLQREVDVSTVDIVRTKDKKEFTLRIGERRVPEEVKADLVYRRNGEKTFTVVIGSIIDLNGSKYRVVNLRNADKKCEVTLEDLETKKQKTLTGLE